MPVTIHFPTSILKLILRICLLNENRLQWTVYVAFVVANRLDLNIAIILGTNLIKLWARPKHTDFNDLIWFDLNYTAWALCLVMNITSL